MSDFLSIIFSPVNALFALVTTDKELLFVLFLFLVFGLVYYFFIEPSYIPRSMESFEHIKIGSNSYKVHEDLTNPKLAAETMDSLNTTAHKMIDILYDKYINSSDSLSNAALDSIKEDHRHAVVNSIKQLKKNFKTANMEENIPSRSGGDTSYVIDKETYLLCAFAIQVITMKLIYPMI